MPRPELQHEFEAAAQAAGVMVQAAEQAMRVQGLEPTPGRLALAALCMAAAEARRAGMPLRTWHLLVGLIRSSL